MSMVTVGMLADGWLHGIYIRQLAQYPVLPVSGMLYILGKGTRDSMNTMDTGQDPLVTPVPGSIYLLY